MEEETFQEIKYPKFHDEAGTHDLTECTCIGEFIGKLGLFAFCPMFDNVGRQPCHFWIMEEYGDKNSWTCHATFMLQRIIRTPLTFTKNGEIIMQDRRGKIFCYNFNNNQLIDLNIQGEGRDLNFVNFTNSLVLVDLYDTLMVEERNFPASGVGDFEAYMHVEQVNMAHKDDPPADIHKNI
ncbi:uncharacterized protein LOC132599630 [Lycium barbarum]|uniref:uncharacterized protein LOC132599630 n=1 Tax=Lycium barbarum TaxID=112863 RepID=UPI00293F546D|nr:uncharacterized protein LOC132599630 [Lycium barbarum]